MAISPTDIKKLWGRAGGRCTICDCDLSPVEHDGVLGEMAHIVASSTKGPRGDSELPAEDRDSYENLILLCPTDHTKIDDDPNAWSVDKLHSLKRQHEAAIRDKHENGLIPAFEADTSSFRAQRSVLWESREDHCWAIASLTPIQLTDDAVDPLTSTCVSKFNEIAIHHPLSSPQQVNPYHTEPSTNGLVNEDFRHIDSDYGFRIELFRSGYLEYALCLSNIVRRFDTSEYSRSSLLFSDQAHRLSDPEWVILYKGVATTLLHQVNVLFDLWESVSMPFGDMIFSLTLTRLLNTCVIVDSDVIGRPIDIRTFHHATHVERDCQIGQDQAAYIILQRLANTGGLWLPSLKLDDGTLRMPITLANRR